jgi:hypothetical protein
MFRSRLLRNGTLGVLAMLALACADSGVPTAPATPEILVAPPLPGSPSGTDGGEWIPIQPTTTPEGRSVKGIRWSSTHVPLEVSVTGTIGPAGGSLAIPGSDFVIHFPEGSLSSPTTITIVSKESAWVSYDMIPHGLVFAKPVYVMQALVHTTAYNTPAAFFVFGAYLSPGNETISPDNTATAAETTPSFIYLDRTGIPTWSVWLLDHFSRYMLASG